jgi:DNA-binding MarR family transcriptional regulator
MLSFLLLKSIPHSMRRIRRLSSGVLEGSITFEHLRTLFQISEGLSQTQIAEIFAISLPAVSKMVHNLEERGLINRAPGEDRRCLHLSLTAKGSKILKTVTSHNEKMLELGMKELTDLEKEDLKKGLHVLNKLMTIMDGV